MKKRIPIEDAPFRWNSPFAAITKAAAFSDQSHASPTAKAIVSDKVVKKNRGRVDIIRQTAHRGGKTVTVATGFVGISQAEKESLAKEMQKACGAGGTVKEGRIEIQGDQRNTVMRLLTKAGFRPVLAGG